MVGKGFLTLSKRGLGRGLEALIPLADGDEERVNDIDIKRIVVSDKQPRKDFDEQKLEELAASIRTWCFNQLL